MGDVIDRWRLNKGWNPLDNESQMMQIQSWVNVMDSERVPATAYNELFVRALKLRASLFAQGKQPPDMGIELMLACWETLAKEIEERRINEKRYLPETAVSDCPRCLGLGREFVLDEKTGRSLGVKPSCDHRPLREGEYLWRKRQAEDKDL